MANTIEDNPGAIDAQIRTTEKRLNNLLDLAGDAGDRALLPRIHELQATLSTLREQKTAGAERNSLKRRLLQIRENDIRRMITANAMLLRGSSNVRGAADPDGILLEMIGYTERDRIELRRRSRRKAASILRSATASLYPELSWRPHGDSNPGYRREREVNTYFLDCDGRCWTTISLM
jgi:hypothetical protein